MMTLIGQKILSVMAIVRNTTYRQALLEINLAFTLLWAI